MKKIHFFVASLVFVSGTALAYSPYNSVCSQNAQWASKAKFGLVPGSLSADFILIDKSRKLMHLFSDDRLIRSYRVALGSVDGKKRQEGDRKTPEGAYVISGRNSASDFYLSLRVSYPNQNDIDWARKNGVSPGGSIMIHGLPNEKWKWPFLGHPKTNWTAGCIAVTNPEIDEIWRLVRNGTEIEICK